MTKSPQRLHCEQAIRSAHKSALAAAIDMVADEFGGDLEKALADTAFVERMQARVRKLWTTYLGKYRELEALERSEGYPGMRAHTEVLDIIKEQLPRDRRFCYYPFSGTDFYWARIFPVLICQDIGFTDPSSPNLWWETEQYSRERTKEICDLLVSVGVIPRTSGVGIVGGDAEQAGRIDANRPEVTLLVKGGHGVVGFLEKRFGALPLHFSAIVTVSAADPPDLLRQYLTGCGYEFAFSHPGTDWIVPFAMDLRDIRIFVKSS